MSDETLIKAEKDFTEILDKELPQIDELAKVRLKNDLIVWPILTAHQNDFQTALDQLLSLEKQTRQVSRSVPYFSGKSINIT